MFNIHSSIINFKLCMLELGSKLSDSLYRYPFLVWDLAITENLLSHSLYNMFCRLSVQPYRTVEQVSNRLYTNIQKNNFCSGITLRKQNIFWYSFVRQFFRLTKS